MVWKLWILLLVLSALAEPNARAAGLKIWIAARTDGVAGTGTSNNPYDGHTAVLFDRIMQGLTPYMVVHLGPGLFKTTGSAGYNPDGFYLPVGCKIIGAGMDLTTLRCVYYPAAAGVNGHPVLQNRMDVDGDGVEVTDLTVDCNWQNLGAAAATKMGAVSLSGNHAAIRRVRAINMPTETGRASRRRSSFP